MPLIDWVASLTPAERDAIRTISIVIGSACVPAFGLVLTWLIRATRKIVREVAKRTETHDFIDGKLVPSSLGEMVRRTMLNTEDLKGAEITNLVSDPRTGPITRTGRRRNPHAVTDQFPSLSHPSKYVGDPDE